MTGHAGDAAQDAAGVEPLRLGVSACLLGREVRYDGGHKRDRFLTDVLGPYVRWVPVCPEVEIGMGTPRPTIRLERDGERVRLVMPSTGEDLTRRMENWSAERVGRLAELDLCGYVLKKDSPTCGMERVKLWDANDVPARDGTGVFAGVLLRELPHLPVEEEGRLNDPGLREAFITRIFAYRRWKDLVRTGADRRRLTEFHAAHKFLLMSRHQDGMRRLGRLLGEAPPTRPYGEVAAAYLEGLTEVLRRVATRRNHTNVLRHLAGFVSDGLDAGDRAELADAIEQYRLGLLPLIVPVTLLRHHVRRSGPEYLRDQVYLRPHPHELMLLNHV
ncbi:MAG: DUF523 and DUF1722 domain-containing protein [Gemmatimonadota bacterium]|nr:DUF523 and DUF1722 domain-containing protein [Gemmatimonadota bacterium]